MEDARAREDESIRVTHSLVPVSTLSLQCLKMLSLNCSVS